MMKIFRWNLIILVELHSIKSYLSSQLYPNLKKKKVTWDNIEDFSVTN